MLLVVPAFAKMQLPSLAAHLLQACARARGLDVTVLYANLALAGVIGEREYKDTAESSGLPGERFFAHSAYGKSLDALYSEAVASESGGRSSNDVMLVQMPGESNLLTDGARKQLASGADDFSRRVAQCIAARSYPVVGCSSTFEQTAASISLLKWLKRLAPEVITVIGGANCEGEMAQGMTTLAACADFIFSGESERTLPDFLDQIRRGELPSTRIIKADSPADMSQLPLPDYSEYFEQFALFLPHSALRMEETWLPYESSRGCWWGEKSHCTFCGLNGETMKHRKKDPMTVFTQIEALLRRYPTKNIFACDNIMPREYFKSLLPKLEALDGLNLFYEQKSNLSMANLTALKRAGVNLIQPGIESLSTPLLKIMRKGVTARQHINVLRNARAVGVSLNWNILYDFPGDVPELYEQMLSFLPHIVHFHPPLWLARLSLDRFSPYYERPETFGISNLDAMSDYYEILPREAEVRQLAYHFVGDYQSGIRSKPGLIDDMVAAVSHWKNLWCDGRALPGLSVAQIDTNLFLLFDSRYEDKTCRVEFLSAAQASQLLTEKPVALCVREDYEWILARHWMLEIDGYFVPLVLSGETASELAESLEAASPPDASYAAGSA